MKERGMETVMAVSQMGDSLGESLLLRVARGAQSWGFSHWHRWHRGQLGQNEPQAH